MLIASIAILGQHYSPILTTLKEKYYHRIGHRFLVYLTILEIYFHRIKPSNNQFSIIISAVSVPSQIHGILVMSRY